MTTVQGQPPPVHTEPPEDPPPEDGPSEADRLWWADQNESWHDDADAEPLPSYWDEAGMSEYLDFAEQGIKII